MTRRYLLGVVLYILAFVLSFLSPAASLTLNVILALLFILPEPDSTRATRRRSAEG